VFKAAFVIMVSQQVQFLTRSMQKLSPEFSDAHCHLNLFGSPPEVIAKSREEGVGLIVTTGGSGKDNAENVRIANDSQGVFAVIGISPDFSGSESEAVNDLKDLIKSSKKVVGIGEIGIDAKAVEKASLDIQRKVFGAQLDIAKDLGLPVVIHSRGAMDEVMRTLEEKDVRNAVFHFFEGDEEQARSLSEKGHLISIPPVETGRRKRVIKNTSLSNLVAETDSPVVGKTPADVLDVCKKIAEIKGVSLEDVAASTTENIRRHFYI
jgi:TatD DNase family protein